MLGEQPTEMSDRTSFIGEESCTRRDSDVQICLERYKINFKEGYVSCKARIWIRRIRRELAIARHLDVEDKPMMRYTLVCSRLRLLEGHFLREPD